MEFILDPNVAYLLLVAGVLLGFLAILAPGTGMLEVGTLFCLALAGYAIYNLSFNWWAMVILILSVIPFILAIRAWQRIPMLALTVVGVIIGSVFMFPAPEGAFFGVNPILATVVSLASGGFLWLALDKSVKAQKARVHQALTDVIGQHGEARTAIRDEGSVQVAGELWSARSNADIPQGSPIKVIGREGFILIVEKES